MLNKTTLFVGAALMYMFSLIGPELNAQAGVALGLMWLGLSVDTKDESA